jgi:predicted XRE-type DNA-binding protein
MARKAIISTPYPTSLEIAEELGVSRSRVAELTRLADEIMSTRGLVFKKRARGSKIARYKLRKPTKHTAKKASAVK